MQQSWTYSGNDIRVPFQEVGLLPCQDTIKLTPAQFDELTRRVSELIVWHQPTGRRRALTLDQAINATLAYLRQNMTQAVIADIHRVSQTAISRAITILTPIIAEVLEEFVPLDSDLDQAAKHEVLVIDGTLLPTWSYHNHPELYSGKHKTTGFNVQVVATWTGQLRWVSTPLDGSTHDKAAYDRHRLQEHLRPEHTIADKGYQGTKTRTPIKKPVDRNLTRSEEIYNKSVNKHRCVIERVIANLKVWRIFHTDYRRPYHTFRNTFRATRALHFFAMRFA